MKVYELIQELVQFDADDEVSVKAYKADLDTTCPECGEEFTLDGDNFETEDLSITGRNHYVTIEVEE